MIYFNRIGTLPRVCTQPTVQKRNIGTPYLNLAKDDFNKHVTEAVKAASLIISTKQTAEKGSTVERKWTHQDKKIQEQLQKAFSKALSNLASFDSHISAPRASLSALSKHEFLQLLGDLEAIGEGPFDFLREIVGKRDDFHYTSAFYDFSKKYRNFFKIPIGLRFLSETEEFNKSGTYAQRLQTVNE
jgi:hypothetical protein